MKGTRIAAAAVVIAAAAFIGYRFLDQEEAEVIYESRPTVTAETPRQEDIILYTELIGTVEPVSKADVIPKMAGEVLEVNFQAGDHVEAGQVLCRLDSDALTSLKLNVDSAQLTLAEAQRSLSRIQALYESGTVSQQELEQVQSAAQNAGIAYKAAQNQYNLQLEYTTITAPISGTVESRNIEVHDFASTGMPICTIASDGQIQVDFGVTERTFSNISVGEAVSIEKGGNTYEATITEIGSMLNAATGLYDVTAVLNEQADLANGSRVKLTVVRDQALGAMTVPLSSVNYDGGISYVYCLENGIAVRTDVEVGIHDEERIEILGGLEDGSQVIYSWSNELVDGAEVLLKGALAAPEEGGSTALEGEGQGESEEADDAGQEAGEDA